MIPNINFAGLKIERNKENEKALSKLIINNETKVAANAAFKNIHQKAGAQDVFLLASNKSSEDNAGIFELQILDESKTRVLSSSAFAAKDHPDTKTSEAIVDSFRELADIFEPLASPEKDAIDEIFDRYA